MMLEPGYLVAIRETIDSPWQVGTVTGFPMEFLVVEIDGIERTLDLAPGSSDWRLVGPPF
jgi:hypothetical protein